MKTRDLGNVGEDLAAEYLQKQGYKIFERNFRSKLGEIDIVALDPSTKPPALVFIEVKTRWTREFGPPEEAITPWKIRRLIKAAQYYKLIHPHLPDSLRLDAVALEMTEDGKLKSGRLIRNLTL